MKIKQGFVLREICGEYVIVPTGEMTLQFNGLMTVNEVGASLWNLLDKDVTFDDLLQGILEEYEVDEATASLDIKEFIDYLKQYHVIEE